MARRGNGQARFGALAALVVIASFAFVPGPAQAASTRARAAAGAAITAQPALQPAFTPAVPNYVVRCSNKVTVSVTDGNGTAVSVDREPVETTGFRTTLLLGPGQRFSMRVGSGTYNVRCLPSDFPRFAAQVSGQRQAAYYLVTPGQTTSSAPAAPYVALFDSNGVPVWWFREPNGIPIDANVTPGGDLAWNVESTTLEQFGAGTGDPLEIHHLDGTVATTVKTGGSATDFHEAQPLPDGNFLMTTYVLRNHVDLSSVFGYAFGPVVDASFQEVAPDGTVVSSWNLAGRTDLTESAQWWFAGDLLYPGVSQSVWDYQHIDSVEPAGDGYLVSLGHTDAIYMIRASDGAVEWKLGGTPTPESLTIVGDADAAADFSGPHDARMWPDGTVSVLDNGTLRSRPARVLRFRIDPVTRTATLIQTLSDLTAGPSSCCGSARLLPGGDWVVDWGATQTIDEFSSGDQPVLRLVFDSPYSSYRAIPVLPGQLQSSALIAAMDKMTPRRAGGTRPPAVSHMHVSPRRVSGTGGPVSVSLSVVFDMAWRGPVRLMVQRAGPGRIHWFRCVAATAALAHHRACTHFTSVGATVKRSSVRGTNRVVISGRVLAPGLYRVRGVSVAGRRSGLAAAAEFRVLP